MLSGFMPEVRFLFKTDIVCGLTAVIHQTHDSRSLRSIT
jgi:hypothetical protein